MCLKPDNKEKIIARKEPKVKPVPSPHSTHQRETKYDYLLFAVPALFWKITPIGPLYLTGILRIIAARVLLTLHYIFADKDNYNNKLTSKQLKREKENYLLGPMLHMLAQVILQIIFPGMFFSDNSLIKSCAIQTFWSHVLLVEPLYYIVHRWLHIPEQMKAMHGFHHLSIHTLPSTSLVQDFHEHFIYIATFGPAFFGPFLLSGAQHWSVICAYLVLFDIVNAFGHMNIRVRSPVWLHRLSPLRYLFYTPEFHLGHHALFRANYGLFMPVWDFLFGTHREYKKDDSDLLPSKQQDFVFIGHNGGLGHLLTCPEFSVYNVYDKYSRTILPLQVEFMLVHIAGFFCRLVAKNYKVSRYLINGSKIGRVICTLRTPIDFMSPKQYPTMNKEIVELIKDSHRESGTRFFGLGNLSKMKQLNEGGETIVKLVKEDSYLKDKNIRIWTGDSLTAASIYNQIIEIPNLSEFFFIGANGKIGVAVCELITKTHPHIKICCFSNYHGMSHPNISYTADLKDMLKYKVVISGKIVPSDKYEKVYKQADASNIISKTRLILDYSVPLIPIKVKGHPEIKHIPIALLQVTNKKFLRGHYDICMGHDQGHIYACHAGCIIRANDESQTDEVGKIKTEEMDKMWKRAIAYGFRNPIIDYQ